MTSPIPEDKDTIQLRVAEAVRDELLEFAKNPRVVSIRDEFSTMWYPAMKAAVDAGYELSFICNRMRAKAKLAFPLRTLEEMYATAKAEEEQKKSGPDAASGSGDSGANVTPITRKRARANASEDAGAVPKTASAAAASDAFDRENDPNDPEALKSV